MPQWRWFFGWWRLWSCQTCDILKKHHSRRRTLPQIRRTVENYKKILINVIILNHICEHISTYSNKYIYVHITTNDSLPIIYHAAPEIFVTKFWCWIIIFILLSSYVFVTACSQLSAWITSTTFDRNATAKRRWSGDHNSKRTYRSGCECCCATRRSQWWRQHQAQRCD